MPEGYDVAQICRNGHVINESSVNLPQFSTPYCKKCGEKTITHCPNCNHNIRGAYWGGGFGFNYKAPAFCGDCGSPFPWTVAKLSAAKELTDELEKLNPEEKALLKRSLDDLVKDTPMTNVASSRFKKLALKAGSEAAQALKSSLFDIASEAAKKQIWS